VVRTEFSTWQLLRGLVQQINAARMPYAPIPELQWNKVNSNSFAYWALGQLGVHQPGAPTGTQASEYDADADIR
jgi:hypothetical protein